MCVIELKASTLSHLIIYTTCTFQYISLHSMQKVASLFIKYHQSGNQFFQMLPQGHSQTCKQKYDHKTVFTGTSNSEDWTSNGLHRECGVQSAPTWSLLLLLLLLCRPFEHEGYGPYQIAKDGLQTTICEKMAMIINNESG